MIDQITVFLENAEGHLKALARTISDAGVDMKALTIADTADYGLVRIICDNPDHAYQVLSDANYRVIKTKVSAIEVPNRPGGLADLLDVLDSLNLNIEYGYCFGLNGDTAIDVLKIHDVGEAVRATKVLSDAGFRVLTQDEIA
ncbi:ACT domain-containing protein [Slackia heliotrinireducens]|uniref:ACT domain-containing protein n=1 Tax=Slackia heliotrinireducens (strain ATCC 29202 / DSM 20476 / NCTC 11029 / RHS 1) TaxID=471855 RepID=C7N3U1_SLAHD|nr:amino acid-binding protein [Slackia heliotrinireducens]ACV21682.1 ACT domain-containing protein [Slackia heliotrinireducens DSM 20476]VEG99305.1 ACT domain-containing protein [Slackia heliotrinireducens]